MEGSLAQERDEQTVGQHAGTGVRIEVDQTTAWQAEPLVISAKLLPEPLRQEEGIALGQRGKPPAGGRTGEARDPEKAVAVVSPIDAVEQAVLLLLVVTERNAPHLDIRPQVESQRGDDRAIMEETGAEHASDQAGRGETCPVD